MFGSGFLAQQGSLASCEVVVEQSRAQDYSGQQVEVFQVRMYIDHIMILDLTFRMLTVAIPLPR